MTTLSPDAADFVRRIIAAHHAGCHNDPDNAPAVKLWHLIVTLCAWAQRADLDELLDELLADARHFAKTDEGRTQFNWREAEPILEL